MYQNVLKESNDDYMYLRRPYLRDNKFGVMSSAIVLDKIDIDCTENIKAEPTVDDSGFIIYSNTIKFSGKWLDNSGYLINKRHFFLKNRLSYGSNVLEEPKK